ncbi:hypothetical protein JCM17092_17110 [Haloplanus litoreus]
MLAASGLVAVGALGGCLDRVASATTHTGASPAAPFAGIGEYTGPTPIGDEPTVYKLTPTASADIGPVSNEVELEAWVTATAIAATCCFDYNDGTTQSNRVGYNNGRSNRATIRGPGDSDSDADGVDDTVEVRSAALELETQLLAQTTEAAASISKRSARTGRNPDTGKPIKEFFDGMMDTIEEVQATLERCSDDVCVTVRDHADGRKKLTQQASAHVDNGEWETASENVQAVQEIVEGDIELLESSLNDAPDEPLGNPRLQELTGASSENVAALYEYLAGKPVLSEQFTITVPDARLSGGGSDIIVGEYLSPRHVIEYVTGRADTDGKVYAWGDSKRASSGGNNTSPIYEGDAVGGQNAIHRGSLMNPGDDDGSPLYNSETFLSAISGPVDTGIHLESHAVDGRVTVRPVNDPPQPTEATPALAVSADGSSSEPADFDEWGSESGESSTTSTLVCPIMVAPPDCPMPFSALLYVRRCKHTDQYIYTGGWVIDDGSLYEDSTTLVAVGGQTEVIGIGAGDLDGDGYGDVMARRLSGDGDQRGARLFDGTVSAAVAEGVLSEAEGNDRVVRKKPGRTAPQEGDTGDGVPVVVAQQGRLPIVHFTESNASDTVKFKAGAELSKSVN